MDACNPSSTTNILEIHGTNDDVTYYDEFSFWTPPTRMVGELIRAFLKPWGFLWTDVPHWMFLRMETTLELPNLDPTDGSQVKSSNRLVGEGTHWDAEVQGWSCSNLVGGGHDWPFAGLGATWTSAPAWWRVAIHLGTEPTNTRRLPLSVETMVPQSEAAVQGTWDILGRPCPSTATGQLLIQDFGGCTMEW